MEHSQLNEANEQQICRMKISYYEDKNDPETVRQYEEVHLQLLKEER